MNNSTNILLTIVGVVIVVAAGFYFWAGDDLMMDYMNDDQSDMTMNDTDTTNTNSDVNNPPATPINRVILDENETGLEINVAAATLTQPGFIVLYKGNSQGGVSMIGISELLAADSYMNYPIQVDAVLAREQSVTAVLFADNGDGEFNQEDDALLQNTNGVLVSDIDVIDMDAEDEPAELLDQAKVMLEAELEEQAEMEAEAEAS